MEDRFTTRPTPFAGAFNCFRPGTFRCRQWFTQDDAPALLRDTHNTLKRGGANDYQQLGSIIQDRQKALLV